MWHTAENRSGDCHAVGHASELLTAWISRRAVGEVGKQESESSRSRGATIKLRLASRSGPCPLRLPLSTATRGIHRQIPQGPGWLCPPGPRTVRAEGLGWNKMQLSRGGDTPPEWMP
eukprot:61784-Rhodomonas_salina.1